MVISSNHARRAQGPLCAELVLWRDVDSIRNGSLLLLTNEGYQDALDSATHPARPNLGERSYKPLSYNNGS